MTRSAFVLATLFLIVFPFISHAHATGVSIERQVGDYLIDIGYDPQNPASGETIRFDFNVYVRGKTEGVPFSNIWVRIETKDGLVFAGGIAKSTFGLTGLTLSLPRPGEYTISVRFNQGDETIVETSVPLLVLDGEAGKYSTLYFIMGGIGIVALGIGLALGRRTRALS